MNPASLNIERPRTLTDLVTERLRDWIITGDMELGSRLSEVTVAKALKVSRTPVREAVNRLEIEGLLRVEPQRGSFVFDIAPGELGKLCDARLCLEEAALTTAIAGDHLSLFKELSTCIQAMKDARAQGDATLYLGLDAEFHDKLVAGSDNKFMVEAYTTMAPRMSALRHRLGRHPDHMAKSFVDHLDLCAAVGDKDLTSAVAILRSHIDRKEGNYWREADQAARPIKGWRRDNPHST